ncbi:MAG TPA: murein biosynthesis integral membrane protein MurJ [Caulobacteraceae bacterium]|nr:murein biosynthesis integral membrane protein MurJ [Caulobacteraceae bacterium]
MSEAAPETPKIRKGGGLIRSSMIFSGLTLVSRLLGFVRDIFITARLGASATVAADAYNTALAFPNLFRRIFAEGAFAAAFVPAYARKLTGEGEEVADQLASNALATIAVATLALTIAAQLAMPWLMYLINPGYVDDPAKFKLAIVLTQITMPYLPCMAITALLSGVLNARGRFIVSAAAPILLNGAILIAVIPARSAVDSATAASWAVVAAGIAQAALIWWGARRTGARIIVAMPRLTPEIKALIALAIPGAIAASATQINIFISGVLASQVAGARSWLAVADRLYQLPLGLVGVAIGVALLPRLSQALQAEDKDDAQSATDQAIVFALALTLPAAAALMAMPYFLIDALFARGEFTPLDARATADALFHYGWGVPAFVLLRVMSPIFFARQDTKAPMRFALISVVVNIVLGVTLFYIIGFEGIAAATSIATWIVIFQMVAALSRRGLYRPSKAAWGRIVRVFAASVALGLVLFAAELYRPAIVELVGYKEVAIVLVSAIGGLLYPVLLFASGGVTIAEVRALVRRRRRG